MVRSCLLLALVLAACGRSDPARASEVQPAPVPADIGPTRSPWTGQRLPAGPGHLPGGGVRASASVTLLRRLLPDNAWLQALEPDSVLTATLARPVDGALHHRISGVLRPGMSWPSPGDQEAPCPPVGSLTCVALPWGKAYVHTTGQALTLDVITHGDATQRTIEDASNTVASPTAAPGLLGDGVVLFDNEDLAAALGQGHIPAFNQASLELTGDPQHLRARMRWTPPVPWSPKTSDAPAPSWEALCSGALACASTGPWPNLHGWLQSLGPADRPRGSGLLAASIYSGTWPHELAASLATLRDRSPELSRGFINMGLDGLAEVEFAGARLDEGDVFVAFVRISATWVNFAASVLPYLGLTPGPVRAGKTDITWAPLQRGGIALALDDGPEPTMGWIAFASSPERFAWLLDAPRTRAQASALTARVARIEDILSHLPARLRSVLDPYADRSATLWVEAEQGQLSLRVDLEPGR